MDEIWKPVASYDGIQASNLGRILFPNREAAMPNGGVRSYKTKPTFGSKRRASKTARQEYMGTHNSFYGNLKIHRLVCEAFHGPPPFKRAVVIHLDEDATNNRADNLKWGTQKENLNMPGFIEYLKSQERKDNLRAKRMANREARVS
jgi:HNH endonuclease